MCSSPRLCLPWWGTPCVIIASFMFISLSSPSLLVLCSKWPQMSYCKAWVYDICIYICVCVCSETSCAWPQQKWEFRFFCHDATSHTVLAVQLDFHRSFSSALISQPTTKGPVHLCSIRGSDKTFPQKVRLTDCCTLFAGKNINTIMNYK